MQAVAEADRRRALPGFTDPRQDKETLPGLVVSPLWAWCSALPGDPEGWMEACSLDESERDRALPFG